MRKMLATVLAVVMLVGVFAAIPAFAAPATTFDGSTEADIPDVIATEIVPNPPGAGDAWEYIEFYNRGDSAVNFYDLSLLRSPNYATKPVLSQDDPYYASKDMWRTTKKFQTKVDITTGAVAIPADATEAGVTLAPGVVLNNPASGTVAAHSFAIVLVLNKNAIDAINEESADYMDVPAELPRIMFREKFNVPTGVPIFYIWGRTAINENDGTIKNNEFGLEDCVKGTPAGFMLALAENTFDLATDTGASSKVKSLFAYGVNQTMYYNGGETDGKAYVYVPADQVPEVVNRVAKKTNDTAPDFAWGGYVESYRQAGMAGGQEKPNPGKMEAYQWYYVDPDNAPAEIKGDDPNWGPAAVQTWAALAAPDGGIDQERQTDEPDDIELNLESREDKESRLLGTGTKKSGKKADAGTGETETASKGLPTGALIGIIAGGVVLVAAVVVAVIIVLKKKKAAPAVEEAPAEETPVEEAPAEEEKKDEE